MLTRFFGNSIDANTLWYAFWTGSARYGEDIRSALFGFGQNFKKGTAFVIPFSENYHMWISRNFCGVAAIEIPAFSIFKKGAYLSVPFSSRSPVLGGRLFCFLRTLSCASKRALEEMEVKIEESEQWKFQTQTNQTGIPFPYRPSRSDGEAHLYSVPIVRGMLLSRPRLSLPGRGRGMYWKGSLWIYCV